MSKMFASRPILAAEWASELETRVMPVEGRQLPVHERVRRKPRLDGIDVRRQFLVAFFQRVEARSRAEDRKVRGPGMGGNIQVVRRSVQRDPEQLLCIEPQDRPAVGLEVSDLRERQIQAAPRPRSQEPG